jgi:hypothetical protein
MVMVICRAAGPTLTMTTVPCAAAGALPHTGGRSYQYVVRAMRAYAKAGLPAAAIFRQQVAARLAIVTCGGPFNPATHHYLDNIIVYAVPVRPAR